ncbi:putative nuclear hormone receptor HR3 isoform X3 [Aphis craccivora]|uniref:Putative nuclear hormone receptor HR3 isoform X3 n=1 Tax=Aphis craccivora TaxID=307492 RepID=A0A6G0ZB00_APHCR|nr:putative nuclear hormone receptor HR3 isoform X3 [Aphis craccivora]
MRKKSTIAVGTGPASVVVIVQPKQEADVETSTEEEVAAAEETIADDPNLPPCPPGIPICSRLFSPSPPPQQTSTSASTSAQLPGPPPAIPISTGSHITGYNSPRMTSPSPPTFWSVGRSVT